MAVQEDWRELSVEAKERLLRRLRYDWNLRARQSQLEPPDENWFIWAFIAGRGSGKTRSGAEWIKSKVTGPKIKPVYCTLVAPTFALCKSVMLEGESGLMNVLPPDEVKQYNRSELVVWMKNGCEIRGFSGREYEKIRGSQCEFAWVDELGVFDAPQEAWDQLMLTMRLGKRPLVLVTTTPRPIPIIKDLVARDGQDVRLVREATYANAANLPPQQLAWLKRRYENSYLGQQELLGLLMDDLPGALWTRAVLEETRRDRHPELTRIGVGVDPAVTFGEDSDETGIVCGGLGVDLHAYITEDVSGRHSPKKWAKIVCDLYHDKQADFIVAEVNNGGLLVEENIHTVDPNANVRLVRASRGKIIRAEPVASLYEQHRVHHVGMFPKLEDEYCTFIPGDSFTGSPDHADAAVWLVHELMLQTTLAETQFALPTGSGRTNSENPFERRFGHQVPRTVARR